MDQQSSAGEGEGFPAGTGDLSDLVNAHDVRGGAGVDLTEEIMRTLGAATVDLLAERGLAREIVVAHDARVSSPAFAAAFIDGAVLRGALVADAGLAATDQLYCASGLYRSSGAMITASHNPPGDNGLKLCLPGARPVGRTDGLDEVRRRAENFLATGIPAAEVPGRAQHLDTLEDYVTTLLGLVQVPDRRRLRVAVDAGNAMAGLTVPAVTAHLPHLEVIPLFFELDGTFPNHPPNPSVSENLNALRERVRTEGADLGLAFDGDADRCVVVDERGEVVPASAITALIGVREVARARAEGEDEPVVVANLVSSRHVQEAVEAAGGRRIRSRVGHAGIKALMAEHRAVFGGEHSAHYYFRDFFFADSGMLAALHVLAALAEGDRTLSALVAEHDPYVASGEINSRPADAGVARDRVEVWAGTVPGASTDDLDGLTVTHWPRGGDAEDGITDDDRGTPEVSEGSGDSVAPRSFGGNWWLSLRSSNTESLLRFNVEAEDTATMERVRDHVLGLIHEADDPEPEPSGPEPETVGNGPGPAMPSSVRALLRCPRCRGALADAPEGLTCLRCDARYVVLEGMADLRPPLGASADA